MLSPTAQRTKDHIAESFLKLLQTKPLEKITVAEVLKEAQISRATFYKYYLDKYHLLNTLQETALDELASLFSQDESIQEMPAATFFPPSPSKAIFTHCSDIFVAHFAKYQLLYRSLLNTKNTTQFEATARKVIEKQIFLTYPKEMIARNSALSLTASAVFLASGLLTFMSNWLTQKVKATKEELTQVIANLLYSQYMIL